METVIYGTLRELAQISISNASERIKSIGRRAGPLLRDTASRPVILRLILMPGLQSGPKGVSEGQRVRVLPTAHSAPEGHLYVKQRGLIIMLVERERNTRSAKVDLILSRPRVTAVSRQMET